NQRDRHYQKCRAKRRLNKHQGKASRQKANHHRGHNQAHRPEPRRTACLPRAQAAIPQGSRGQNPRADRASGTHRARKQKAQGLRRPAQAGE
ncbi:hypothetical protein IW150_007107, partial [Coemansia sp. RSA 2607]